MKYIIIYSIESSVCLLLFMVFYYFILRGDTHHKSNRAFLLLSLIASLTFPLLEINFNGLLSPINNKIISTLLPSIVIYPKGDASVRSFSDILFSLYIAGTVLASASLIGSSARIIMLILKNKPSEDGVVKFNNNKPSCFSAFGYIFISNSVPQTDSERMIKHEMNHIKKYHSIDLLIIAIAGVIQWFNPAIYFLRRSLQAVHEYEADQECILNGEEIDSYQSLLISAAFGTHLPVLTNKFSNTSLLKKRITMMTKKRTGSLSSMKMLLALPLAALMFFTFSCKEKTPATDSTGTVVQKQAKDAGIEASTEKGTTDMIYTEVEEMPSFPGGFEALMKYIYSNIKYPDAAIKKGIHGKVSIKFAVDKEGNVILPSVASGVDPLLDEAALDVIKTLPKFTPGKKGGENVSVWFTLPISFKLE